VPGRTKDRVARGGGPPPGTRSFAGPSYTYDFDGDITSEKDYNCAQSQTVSADYWAVGQFQFQFSSGDTRLNSS
jgi:hypothetical protein